MPTEIESKIIIQDNWTLRVLPPQPGSTPASILLMIHGVTGNENSMWIFARKLSKSSWKLAPRGPFNAPEGGYSWLSPGLTPPGKFGDYAPVAQGLIDRVDRWGQQQQVDTRVIDLLGFSQGTFVVYALGLLFPERIRLSAALAGYLPTHWLEESSNKFLNKSFFIAHGTEDNVIPIAYARETVKALEAHGAIVDYCEAPVGHKLSPDCVHGMEDYFYQAAR